MSKRPGSGGVLLAVGRCWFGPGGSAQPSIRPELLGMLMGFSAASAAPNFRNGCVCESGLSVAVRTDRCLNPTTEDPAPFNRSRDAQNRDFGF